MLPMNQSKPKDTLHLNLHTSQLHSMQNSECQMSMNKIWKLEYGKSWTEQWVWQLFSCFPTLDIKKTVKFYLLLLLHRLKNMQVKRVMPHYVAFPKKYSSHEHSYWTHNWLKSQIFEFNIVLCFSGQNRSSLCCKKKNRDSSLVGSKWENDQQYSIKI